MLLTAFDWDGGHLHEFEADGVRYGPPELIDPFGVFPTSRLNDEYTAVLAQVAARPGAALAYTYDLGDDWHHRIEVEQVGPAEPDQLYPCIVAGQGLAPEEDTGDTRPGRFDQAELRALNEVLHDEEDAVAGRDLATAYSGPVDPVFAGLFPGFAAQLGAPCTCGADHEDESAPVLRPYQPVEDAVLAELAALSPLVQQALALARSVGENRALTPSRLLRPADALRIVTELGLTGLPAGTKKKLRSAKDLPELNALWSATLEAGLIEINGSQAGPGEGIKVWQGQADPGERLESWARLLAGFLRARDGGDTDLAPIPSDELVPVSAQLFYTLARSPIPAAMPAFLLAASTDDPNPLGAYWMFQQLPAAIDAIALDWLRAGVLARVDDARVDDARVDDAQVDDAAAPTPQADAFASLMQELLSGLPELGLPAELLLQPLLEEVSNSPVVHLTALGSWGLRRLLLAHGYQIPLIGECAGLAPELLLDNIQHYAPEDAIAEAEIWLAGQAEQWPSALQAVAETARTKDPRLGPGRRAAFTGVLTAAGSRIAPMLDSLEEDPWLGAVAASARHGLDLGPELTLDQELWLAIDDLTPVLAADNDERAAEVDQSEIIELLSGPGTVAAAVACTHPYTRQILALVADHCPDRQLAQNLRHGLGARPLRMIKSPRGPVTPGPEKMGPEKMGPEKMGPEKMGPGKKSPGKKGRPEKLR